ncbi:hypothetical protein [Heyndrickxia acidicola]|jgi:uncharacterized protein YlxW (UPF0749 family)|uniref:Lipoprotein n=1 Tax=Heyndrickxia acidicola TaxID=209389 RepID=A0ABU6MD33_9BACI|nr:hypothetical protein [Heyndrickxia acidicola]MED1202344.1 hypothetical protein [Heyndrickxia acidicola]
MRKIGLLALCLSLIVAFTAACSNGSKKQSSSDTSAKSGQKADAKSELMSFYMNLVDKINAQDSDLNAYESAIGQDPAPTGQALKDLQTKAETSASNVVPALKDVTVPASLSAYKSDLETTIKDLQDGYQMKADELKKAKPSLDAANAKLAAADAALGNAFQKAGLQKASIVTGVS